VKSLYGKIQSDFGTVDVLVNNAGLGTSALPIEDVDPEDFWYDFVSEIETMSAIIGCSRFG
jgi:NAD(P)-dependent dehydrogenase (short-subunit alcohol dehydrogenase family)